MTELAAVNIFIQEKHAILENALIIAQVIWIKDHVITKSRREFFLYKL